MGPHMAWDLVHFSSLSFVVSWDGCFTRSAVSHEMWTLWLPCHTSINHHHTIPSVSYTPGAVSIPMQYPLQRTDSFPALQQHTFSQQQPLQMLENAFNSLMSRALTTRNDQPDLGIARNSDAFIDRLGNLSDSGRISEQTTDENG